MKEYIRTHTQTHTKKKRTQQMELKETTRKGLNPKEQNLIDKYNIR